MSEIMIPKSEFQERIVRIQAAMAEKKLDAMLVYGDEYRKENLRYVCNFWPIFERAVCVIPRSGEPVLAGAPEGENYAREMSVWRTYCNVREFACVSVPEEIDYPLAEFVKLADVIGNALKGGKRLGVVGWYSRTLPRSFSNSASSNPTRKSPVLRKRAVRPAKVIRNSSNTPWTAIPKRWRPARRKARRGWRGPRTSISPCSAPGSAPTR